MAKKSSKIISQNAPKPKEKMSGGAKFGITICLLVLAVLGFAIAERFGITGTNFLFRGEVITESDTASSPKHKNKQANTAKSNARTQKSAKAKTHDDEKRDASEDRDNRIEDAQDADDPTPNKRKKSSSSKKATTVAPFPLAIFFDISRNPQTWPAFVRLTRSRTISITDPETGISMGRMDIPARTVVKIIKVNANGTLDVFDRTGQKFQVDASGTNFSAAFMAAKTKPKKKPKKQPTKTVAKKQPQPRSDEPSKSDTETPKKQNARMSAFGTLITDEEWDEAEWED